MKEKELIDVFQIVERASNVGIMFFDRISLRVDLSVAYRESNLRLGTLLNSDDINFAHDIVGIQDHMDREDRRMSDGFLPRYSSL